MRINKYMIAAALSGVMIMAEAIEVTTVTSTEGRPWVEGTVKLSDKPKTTPVLTVDDNTAGTAFDRWGMTFNELDYDALQLLSDDDRETLMRKFFAPGGEMHFGLGRISPGANDYARSWYSCDETKGDLELRHFNIDRDREAIIPFIKWAQKLNPEMKFWISPWSPPSWMKINGDYPVLSSKYNNQSPDLDYLLYSGVGGETDEDEMKLTGPRDGVFPRQLATTDYFIQDPRYLSAYAEYFCRFIDEYAAEGIPIGMVMYQNEAYSYTPYPGCAWTADGIIRFNRDFLAPRLKERHPDVKLYLGTFNTNRLDHVEKLLADSALCSKIEGMGFQWEGREILPEIRKKHPELKYISSESECGWGSFDWKAAEHTFELINHYLGTGCNEYNFWNIILTDIGESPWGWKQNALVRVDSAQKSYTLTPEYHAVRHYTDFITEGSQIVGYKPEGSDKMPVLIARTPSGSYSVMAANFNEKDRKLTVSINGKYLNVILKPHSLNSFSVD